MAEPSVSATARPERAERAVEGLEGAPPPMPPRRVIGFVLRQLARHPLLLAAHLLAAALVAAADVVSVTLVTPFLETMGGGSLFPRDTFLGRISGMFDGLTITEKIRAIALLLVLVQVMRAVFSYLETRIASYLGVLFERDLRAQVFDDLLAVDLRYLHRERTGRLVELIHNYPRQAGRIVRDYLGTVARTGSAGVLVVMLWYLDWQLTVVGLVVGVASLLMVTGLRRLVKRVARQTQETRVRLQQASIESLQSMKIIRFFAREDHARKRFGEDVARLQKQSFRDAALSAAVAPLQRTLNTALFAALIAAATYVLPRTGAQWVLLLTLFLVVMSRLAAPLANFASRGARIATETPALEAIIHFLESPKPRLPDGDEPFGRLREGVRFENVGFAYQDGSPVLEGISFTLPRGGKVALVGESGSGKSTLVQLLSRLSDPTLGRIQVDGQDLRTLRSAQWRRRVAVVSQDTQLFHDTVRENIRFGRLDATDAEVEEAARLANADGFIREMPEGYGTRVGERGARLSGGQAQRIAIARAILADPDILVLDEATSALDTATERLVQGALERASRGRTVLAIAHRLSTVRGADRILVLEKGRIVEEGTHADLLARGGRYARFVRLQDVTGEEAAAEPAAPVRVLLAGNRARVLLADGAEREVPVVVRSNGADPAAAVPDAVVLTPGQATGAVRIAGTEHAGVDLFAAGADGREVRVRVAEVRGR